MNTTDDDIKKILEQYKHIAVYGLSPDTAKPSHYVPKYMQSQGYGIVGVYPKSDPQAGFTIFRSLAEVPIPTAQAPHRKFVNVFRRSESIPEVVDEVLAVGGVEVLWLQLGIFHEAAEKRAEAAGIKVVSDRCLYVEHKKYF